MPEWKELEKLKSQYPEQVVIVSLDVGSTESVKEAAKETAKHTNHLDMLVNCAGIFSGQSPKEVKMTMNINSVGPIRMVEAFLPLMQQGMKRLCFVSSEAGSIALAHRQEGFSYCMSKASLNMAIRLLFNELQKQGYTFRLYHPGWVRTYMEGKKSTMGNFDAEETAQVAYRQFTQSRECESVLVMTDVSDEAWPF